MNLLKQWLLEGKLALFAIFLGVASLGLPWIDLGVYSTDGINTHGFVALVPWIYPMVVILARKALNKILVTTILLNSAIFAAVFALNFTTMFVGREINISGSGLHLFILSTILLFVGCLKYRGAEDGSRSELSDSPSGLPQPYSRLQR